MSDRRNYKEMSNFSKSMPYIRQDLTDSQKSLEMDSLRLIVEDGLGPAGKPVAAFKAVEAPKKPEVIVLVVLFYFCVSLAVVFLNKFILTSNEYKFPYPLITTWYQLFVALIILVVAGKFGQGFGVWSVVPPFEFDLKIAYQVAPLTFVYVMMLALNNLCLNHVEVTFYQVARSLTILFNIFFSYAFLGQSTSMSACFATGIVFAGFVIGSYGEMHPSFYGLIFGVGASAFVALYSIFVKKTLVFVDNNQWRLLHYNTAIALVMMLPLVIFSGELSDSLIVLRWFWSEPTFALTMTVTGVTGFLINIAVFLQIKFTTPLTNNISGTAKACVQTLLAWVIWQNPITTLNGIGIFLSLFGSGLYSWVRLKEMNNK